MLTLNNFVPNNLISTFSSGYKPKKMLLKLCCFYSILSCISILCRDESNVTKLQRQGFIGVNIAKGKDRCNRASAPFKRVLPDNVRLLHPADSWGHYLQYTSNYYNWNNIIYILKFIIYIIDAIFIFNIYRYDTTVNCKRKLDTWKAKEYLYNI